MKKLSLIFALALSLAFSAFAEENHKVRKIRISEKEWIEIDTTKTKKFSKEDCFNYSIGNDDNLHYKGKKVEHSNGGISDMLGLKMACGELKGEKEAKQRQAKRDKEYQKKQSK